MPGRTGAPGRPVENECARICNSSSKGSQLQGA